MNKNNFEITYNDTSYTFQELEILLEKKLMIISSNINI